MALAAMMTSKTLDQLVNAKLVDPWQPTILSTGQIFWPGLSLPVRKFIYGGKSLSCVRQRPRRHANRVASLSCACCQACCA